ncbi:helix-turn-helix transcriptional regulator [Fusibacter bizertensis]|uniref:Helix-turn-helix transcriptional regulator n=1 Tax=Fusibacter bizertensis TaxID=1488331 RepID=A0ABT6NAG1_9FIRM|nr:helix-turn-helix transcriptional regulator [Fusibacter bizertensis]MDH8677402.1 helix-turn-helix transcriptional regulator [Fusibacter bizertensis]
MRNLGTLIKKIRTDKQMSVKALAENICSEKFIYLIEKGERNPSVSVLSKIGYKLDLDLYEYLPYISCENPDFAKKVIDQFEVFRFNKELEKLYQLTNFVKDDPNFQTKTWSGEIDFNFAIYELFKTHDYDSTFFFIKRGIEKLDGKLDQFDKIELFSLPLTKLYNLLMLYYYNTQKNEKGDQLLAALYNEVHKKRKINAFKEIYISIAINYFYSFIEQKELIELEKALLEFKAFQLKCNKLSRIYITYFLLAKFYFIKGDNVAKNHFIDLFLVFGKIIDSQKDYQDLKKIDFIQDYINSKYA